MTKLSTAQIQALHEINAKVAVDLITAKSVTITSLDKRGLIYKGSYVGGVPAWYLTEAGKAAIGISDNEDLPRLDGVEEILPGESIEVTGSYAGGHSQEQILELLGEEVQESDEAELPEWKQELLTEMSERKSTMIRQEMETEFTEGDEAPVPFFNRKARREMRRNVARFGRRNMREQGKRIRKFGPHDPMYFRRKHVRMMAETSDLVLTSA